MEDKGGKRRLRILNEVLPSPTVGEAESAPRQRTLAHMQRLMALAAASATLGSGCHDNSHPDPSATTAAPMATAEPPPPPPPPSSATPADAPSGSAPGQSYEKPPPPETTAGPSASAPPKHKPPPAPPKPPKKGYWVVDLLSPPILLPVLPPIGEP